MNRRSKREVTTIKTELIPQKHGGALLSGGKRGNKGGGRTPNEIRALMREPLAKLLPKGTYFLRWHTAGIALAVPEGGRPGTYHIAAAQLGP